MATKDEIVTTLQTLGIAHDPAAPKADLAALIPQAAVADETVAPVVEAPAAAVVETPAPVVDPAVADRAARWAAFLVKVRNQNPVQFDERNAKGEFNSAPDSWN